MHAKAAGAVQCVFTCSRGARWTCRCRALVFAALGWWHEIPASVRAVPALKLSACPTPAAGHAAADCWQAGRRPACGVCGRRQGPGCAATEHPGGCVGGPPAPAGAVQVGRGCCARLQHARCREPLHQAKQCVAAAALPDCCCSASLASCLFLNPDPTAPCPPLLQAPAPNR